MNLVIDVIIATFYVIYVMKFIELLYELL